MWVTNRVFVSMRFARISRAIRYYLTLLPSVFFLFILIRQILVNLRDLRIDGKVGLCVQI